MTDGLTPGTWENLYVIMGSSSAALIGLQFVVLTLIAEHRTLRIEAGALSAFATSTVVHFAAALFVSAVMTTPWPSRTAIGIALAACGLAGASYVVRAALHARRQTVYRPVGADWLWYVLLPAAGYASLALGGWLVHADARLGPFLAAGAALVLLFIGIHNAWDTVTFIVTSASADDTASDTADDAH